MIEDLDYLKNSWISDDYPKVDRNTWSVSHSIQNSSRCQSSFWKSSSLLSDVYFRWPDPGALIAFE